MRFIGVIVPRRLRADWRQEWEAELRTAKCCWPSGTSSTGAHKLDLLRRSPGAFWDALWLQPKRWRTKCFKTCVMACECC